METKSNNIKNSNNIWKPEICVLGPGGMKGYLELGALIFLQKRGVLDDVKTYICCSVGAAIGLYLVLGFMMNDIIDEALSTNLFKELNSIKFDDIKKNIGLINNREIKQQLTDRCVEKIGYIPSLKQIYDITGISFICVSLNLDTDEIEYLSWITDPDLSVVDATLLSMNIPLLFQKIRYNGHIYIDGAFGNPYPVDYLDDGKKKILGISITTKNPSVVDSTDTDNLRYIYKTINASITQLKKRIMNSCSKSCKHLLLHSPTMDTTGLSFTSQMKLQMIKIGYQTAKKFVSQELYEISDENTSEKYIEIIESSEEIPYDENS